MGVLARRCGRSFICPTTMLLIEDRNGNEPLAILPECNIIIICTGPSARRIIIATLTLAASMLRALAPVLKS